ncbi:MAG: hypothetical protein WAX89_05640 [Alphaproteobacteria bacterium]
MEQVITIDDNGIYRWRVVNSLSGVVVDESVETFATAAEAQAAGDAIYNNTGE